MTVDYLEHKKIALRFLKELGLLSVWKRYIYGNIYRIKEYSHKWYKHECIDSIFGDSCFTSFLSQNYGIRVHTTVSELFRYWIIYNDIPHTFKYELQTPSEDFKQDVSINIKTKKMSLKNVPNE